MRQGASQTEHCPRT